MAALFLRMMCNMSASVRKRQKGPFSGFRILCFISPVIAPVTQRICLMAKERPSAAGRERESNPLMLTS